MATYMTTTAVNSTMTTGTGTSTLTVVVGPVDIHCFEKFCVTIRNNYTAGGLIGLTAQMTNDPELVSSIGWINVPTTTLALNSQIGPTAIMGTTAIENCYRWRSCP